MYGFAWLRRSRAAVALFLILLVAYLANGDILASNDAKGSLNVALSVIHEGNLSIRPSEARTMFVWMGPTLPISGKYYVTPTDLVDGKTGEVLYVSTFGIGAPLAALPVLAPLDLVLGDLHKRPRALWLGGKVAAALAVAGSAVVLYLAMRRKTSSRRAWGLALAYGLGTCAWSVSSQVISQHAADALCLAFGIFFFWRDGASRRAIAAAGFAFALATWCRPTSVCFLVAGALFHAFRRDRERFAAYVLGAMPAVVLLASYHTYYLGAPWATAQAITGAKIAVSKVGVERVFVTPVWEGALGLLVSPSRGLFMFSPFLLFALGGVAKSFRERDEGALQLRTLAAGIVAALAVESMHFDWWGGWSYGYRHIVGLTVPLTILIVPVLDWIQRRPLRVVAAGALVVWSVAVQALGAFTFDLIGWNAPVARDADKTVLDVDKPPFRYRLWSLRDNEIAYYVTHAAEARANRKRLHERTAAREE